MAASPASNNPISPSDSDSVSSPGASSPPGGISIHRWRLTPQPKPLSSKIAQPRAPIRPLSASGPSPLAAQTSTNGAVTVNKMAMESVISPAPQVLAKGPISVTSKEWVIPPRPKPGRKPATDTPPTKRKAQNRAAQRAFRERRAARVGELEDQLEEQKAEHDRTEREMQERIRGLETEVQVLRSRCQVLENLLEKEKTGRTRTGSGHEAVRRWTEDTHNSASLPNGNVSAVTVQPQQQSGHGGIGPTQRQLSYNHSRGSTSSVSTLAGCRKSSAQPFSISQIISPPEDVPGVAAFPCASCNADGPCACADKVISATSSLGCGNCSFGSRCECLEATIALSSAPATELKRPHPPGSPSPLGRDEKKLRPDPSIEIDFTNAFGRDSKRGSSASATSTSAQQSAASSYLPLPSQQSQSRQVIPPGDTCGFCTVGTYCVCAEDMAPGGAASQQVQTPPPSETDVAPSPIEVTATGAIKLPSLQSLQQRNKAAGAAIAKRTEVSSSCGPGGPGTCAQCLADPKSGLFCRSLAANFERQGGSGSGGCCGQGGPGGCCKSAASGTPGGNGGAKGGAVPAAAGAAPPGRKPDMGLSLSCADAYKTLASHRHFDEATDDIGAWLPLLKAAPRPDDAAAATAAAPANPARHPMEVEAASIMGVLKVFDVRFGN